MEPVLRSSSPQFDLSCAGEIAGEIMLSVALSNLAARKLDKFDKKLTVKQHSTVDFSQSAHKVDNFNLSDACNITITPPVKTP